jgi:sugar-specific transcriptional regulator TrmB
MNNQLLEQLGFSEKEISVYLEVLRHGKITPTRVAKITGINRSTVYAVAEDLNSKGIITKEIGQKIVHFVAKPVDEMESICDEDRRKLERKKKIVQEAIKELEQYPKNSQYSVPKIRFIEEDNLENSLYGQQKIWVLSAEKFDRACWGFQDHSFAENFQKWINWAWKNFQLDVNLLSNQSAIEKHLKKEMPNKRIIKFWEENINFSSSLWVMGDYVVTIVTRQKPFYAVEMYDAVLAHNLREVFKQIWKSIK